MLRNFLNIVNVIVFLTPALMAGVSFSALAATKDKQEKQIKPNIHQLTNENSAKKAEEGVTDEETSAPATTAAPRIPGEIHKHSLGIGFGQTFLRSSLGDNGNDKITADLYYNYSASYSFDFLANAHWDTYSYLDRSAATRGLALAIKGKLYQIDAFSPFVFGGFGFYSPSVKRYVTATTLAETRSQVVFGVNAGAGVELKLNSKVTVGAIMHYHDPFDVRQDTGPTLQASYLKILLTAFYTFN